MADKTDDLLISVSTDLTTIKRQLKQLGQDIGTTTSGIQRQFDGLGKGIDKSLSPVQKRINEMVGLPFGPKLKEWQGALATVGKTSAEVTQGFKLSRIGMMEMQAAGVNAFQALASGMSAVRVAQMEGAQVLGALVQGTEGGLKGLGNSVVGLVTKFPYITAAVAALGVAFIAYEAIGGKTIASVDDALTEHAKTIKALREAYGIAGDGADDYARRSIAAIESAQRRAEAALRESVAAEEKKAKAALSDNGGYSGFGILQQLGLVGDSTLNAIKTKFAAFAEPIRKFKENLNFDELQQSLDRIAATDPGRLRSVADEILGIVDPAAKGQEALDNMSVALNGLSQAQIDTAHIVAQINNIEAAAFAANAETHAFLTMLNSMDSMVSGKGDAIGGKGSMDRAQASFNQQLEMYRRFGYDDKTFDPNKPKAAPKTRGSRAPAKTAADQFVGDLQSIKDRTAALAEEQSSLGLTYEAQQKRQISLQLEQTALKQVREEARKKGDVDWQNAQLTPDQIAKIDAVSEAYARQADALKKAQEMQQLQRDVLKGAFDDLRSSLEQGQLSWKTFADIATHALDKIIDKIENDLIDSIMQANSASGGGGLGGTLGAIFGGGGGGSDPGIIGALGLRASGGPVTAGQPYIVGEKRAELFVPNTSGTIVPRVPDIMSGGGGGQNNSIMFAPTINVQGGQGDAGQQVTAALKAYQKDFTNNVVKAIRDAKTRGLT